MPTDIELKKREIEHQMLLIERFRCSVATQDDMLLDVIKGLVMERVAPLVCDLARLRAQA